jgi:DNA repair exonuclease SbcCD ATPase subunit
MRVAFSKLKTDQPRQTINGKLVGEANRLEQIDSRIQDLTQQIEYLGAEIIAAEQRDRKEYINQLKVLKLSVQNLEQLYRKLLFVCLAPVVLLTVLCLSIGLTARSEANKSQHNTAGATAITPASSPDLIQPPY